MKKRLNNEHGLTLAELLATLVIGSFIFILIMSAFIFVQKQFTTQKGSLQENTDISIALKSITRDARAADTITIVDDETIAFELSPDETVIYTLTDGILTKNDSNYIYDIDTFLVEKETSSKFTITIKGNSGKETSTQIVQRGGESNEENDENQ